MFGSALGTKVHLKTTKWECHDSDPFKTEVYTNKMNTQKLFETNRLRKINVVALANYGFHMNESVIGKFP